MLPETKGLTLEELDAVFSKRTRDHAAYQGRQVIYFIRRYVMFQKSVPWEPFYEHEKIALALSSEKKVIRGEQRA